MNSNQGSSAASSAGGSNTANAQCIAEIWDEIERNPPAIKARRILIQQWIKIGCIEAAKHAAQELLQIEPSDSIAQQTLGGASGREPNPAPKLHKAIGKTKANLPSSTIQHRSPQLLAVPETAQERTVMEKKLVDGYQTLAIRAKVLLQEARLVQGLLPCGNIESLLDAQIIPDLKALVDGRLYAVVSAEIPQGVRAVARTMDAERDRALEIAVADLVTMAQWIRSTEDICSGASIESIRDRLSKRAKALAAALPEDMEQHASIAFMHVEHEKLDRKYVNNETMTGGDPVASIPRSNFWATEDGYAWDMEELANAVAANNGVMRNPLSRQMFTPNDVHAIVQHPLGRRLAAMHVEQGKLAKGVRKATIDQLERLSAVLLADMSTDQRPSRQALDDFQAYMATLPQAEQKALDELRVPAVDSHTGQPFDCTIGESVRDLQANKICLHKSGDLIGQAAKHLRQFNTA